MNSDEVFDAIRERFGSRIELLCDKPEETVESIIRACWFHACGVHSRHDQLKHLSLPLLNVQEHAIFEQCMQQKLEKMPLAYITGRQVFMGIEFFSDKRAMIPRKETEILARKALEISRDMANEKKIIRVMDICCGTGCVGLSLAHFNRKTIVFSSDLSHDAVSLAMDNIHLLGLQHRVHASQGNLFLSFQPPGEYEHADIVICNPPYISSAKVAKMDNEIAAHEPALAFDGGVFGLTILDQFISQAPEYVVKEGWILFEIGAGQGDFMVAICSRSNLFSKIETVRDAAGIIRVILLQKK